MNNGTHRNPGKWGTDFHTARVHRKNIFYCFFLYHTYGVSTVDRLMGQMHFHSIQDTCVCVCMCVASW